MVAPSSLDARASVRYAFGLGVAAHVGLPVRRDEGCSASGRLGAWRMKVHQPTCTCPRLDNRDLAGSGHRWVSADCPIHGDLMFHPLDRSRYWEGTFGPPTADAEANFIEDLSKERYRRQYETLMALEDTPLAESHLGARVDRRALTDLHDVGLVHSGVSLRLEEWTFRLSRLGRLIKDELADRRS